MWDGPGKGSQARDRGQGAVPSRQRGRFEEVPVGRQRLDGMRQSLGKVGSGTSAGGWDSGGGTGQPIGGPGRDPPDLRAGTSWDLKHRGS